MHVYFKRKPSFPLVLQGFRGNKPGADWGAQLADRFHGGGILRVLLVFPRFHEESWITVLGIGRRIFWHARNHCFYKVLWLFSGAFFWHLYSTWSLKRKRCPSYMGKQLKGICKEYERYMKPSQGISKENEQCQGVCSKYGRPMQIIRREYEGNKVECEANWRILK